jgi:hypothetical protein
VFSQTDTGPNNPANLVTNDNSCTVPRIKGNPSLPVLANGGRYVPFMNYRYTGSGDEAGPNTLDRTREGYFELIEMGEVVSRENFTLSMITHGANGLPANCLNVERAWLPIGSGSAATTYWSVNALADMDPPDGGLFGSASIVNVLSGTMMSYDAEAIGAFSNIVQHTSPDSSSPTLANAHESNAASTVTANVFRNGTIEQSRYPVSRAIDAVSALFAQEHLFNQFDSSTANGMASEWILTFPTKYAYVDQAIVGPAAIAPFTRVFPTVSTGADTQWPAVDTDLVYYDREQGTSAGNCDPTDPLCLPISPPPPPPPSARTVLHWATNVLSFNQPAAGSLGSMIVGSRLVQNINSTQDGIDAGWTTLRLYSPYAFGSSLLDRQRLRADLDGGSWLGLPVVGFWASMQTNAAVTPGVLSRHADTSRHRGTNTYVFVPSVAPASEPVAD